MRVNRVAQRLYCRLRFHRSDALGNQFVGMRSDNVHAKDLAVLLIGNDLYESGVAVEYSRFAVSDEGKFAHLDLKSLSLCLSLRQADTSNTRLRVGAAGNSIAVDRYRGLSGYVIE